MKSIRILHPYGKEIKMTYDEKRELRLQISQLLTDAGLNQHIIKEMVETEIKNKVDRAVEQAMTSLNSECSSGNYVKEKINSYFLNSYVNQRAFNDVVKEELKNRVIKIVVEDSTVN